MKTPQWFQEWVANDWQHLYIKVEVLVWCLGFVAAMTAAVLIKVFLG